MDTSQKMITLGIGAIVGGLMLIIGIVLGVFSDRQRAKRLWVIIVPSLIIGITLILLGSLIN